MKRQQTVNFASFLTVSFSTGVEAAETDFPICTVVISVTFFLNFEYCSQKADARRRSVFVLPSRSSRCLSFAGDPSVSYIC